jgi:hypothetical protein
VSRLTAPLLLAALWLLVFHDLLSHPGQVLYADHSDLLAEHIPTKRFLVRSFHEDGELPRWNPYQFAGLPFLHDIQVAAFYPPHALLLLLQEEQVGPALSWLLAAHVLLAGWTMYAYGRWQGLSRTGAFVAAAGYMLAGKWLLHLLAAGHYILIGLAWLPLVLLCLEWAIHRGSLAWATAAGVAFALLTLGTQPQWTFYAGIFIALWTFDPIWRAGWRQRPEDVSVSEDPSGRIRHPARRVLLLRWLGYGFLTALLAAGLAAVQLLPTAEAAGYSTRSLGVGTTEVLEGGIRSILFLVGPALQADPPYANLQWEDRGGLTLLWLTAAALGGWWVKGRRYQAGVTLALLLFAVGGAYLVQSLPGFNLFRQHTRMFVILGLPVALFAGAATDALFDPSPAGAELRRRGRWLLSRLAAALLILAGGFALRTALGGKTPRFEWYWPSLALTVPAAWWLLSPACRRHAAALWTALLLLDLGALTAPLAITRPEDMVFPETWDVAGLGSPDCHSRRQRTLDRNEPGSGTAAPLGTGAPLALLHRIEALRGYSPLDYLHYKQYLQFIAGSDEPLSPLGGPFTSPVLSDFPIVHKPLLDLLGTRYLLQPAELPPPGGDGWGEPPDSIGCSTRVSGPLLGTPDRDSHLKAYDFITGGVHELPMYHQYENTAAFPRTFVVSRAERLPDPPDTLAKLVATDLRHVVLLEGDVPPETAAEVTERAAWLREYRPNRVVVRVGDGPAGWLVLTDVWYPGWVCTVDGQPTEVRRADYLFRAVRIPEGVKEVVFRFEPDSLRWGQRISMGTLALVAVLLLGTIIRSRYHEPRKTRKKEEEKSRES